MPRALGQPLGLGSHVHSLDTAVCAASASAPHQEQEQHHEVQHSPGGKTEMCMHLESNLLDGSQPLGGPSKHSVRSSNVVTESCASGESPNDFIENNSMVGGAVFERQAPQVVEGLREAGVGDGLPPHEVQGRLSADVPRSTDLQQEYPDTVHGDAEPEDVLRGRFGYVLGAVAMMGAAAIAGIFSVLRPR